MDFKIKFFVHNSVNITIIDDFEKMVSYYKSHNVNLICDYDKTDVSKDNALLQLMQPNNGKFDCVMYIYNRNVFQMQSAGLTFRVSPTLVGIYVSTTQQDDAVGGTWTMLCHEILHAITYKISKDKNINLPNVLDFPVGLPQYYKNDFPDALDGNYAQAWKQLTPYITPNSAPSVVLTRFSDDGVQTLGNLNFGGFACKTMERPWKLNQKNISCIPRGTYQVKYTFSWKFLKSTYEIQNVPNRTGIRIHSGNYFFDIDGCIILGDKYGDLNHDKWADLMNSRATLTSFEKFMNYKSFNLILCG